MCLGFSLVRPRPAERMPIEVQCPLRGTWTVVHSPADAVPSHGVRGYAQTYAIDIIRPHPPGSVPTYAIFGGFDRPDIFASFDEPIRAAAGGTVVRVLDSRRDHLSTHTCVAAASRCGRATGSRPVTSSGGWATPATRPNRTCTSS